ncbi:hypothetical protein F0562_029442 [Nyssa sinensis]|uniref:Uncharacterized protein n=1 Tax=Nyssa sinensis TaxID=561372 RepID=A0A5J5B353_9ASTE|nr:hypothetical protein F0562_029442 [Nyssa sinensis]
MGLSAAFASFPKRWWWVLILSGLLLAVIEAFSAVSSPLDQASLSIGSVNGVDSRIFTMEEVLNALEDHEVKIIMKCGGGGVGKTVKEDVLRFSMLFRTTEHLNLEGLDLKNAVIAEGVSNTWSILLRQVVWWNWNNLVYVSDRMEEVFKERGKGRKSETIKIEFSNLKHLKLVKLRALTSVCNGINEICFPQLNNLYLHKGPTFKSFCLQETILVPINSKPFVRKELDTIDVKPLFWEKAFITKEK